MDDIKNLCKALTDAVKSEMEGGVENVCTEEVGEVIDMIKDLTMAMYYYSIVEAMERGDTENLRYIR